MAKEKLLVIPLGGLGEIGKNMLSYLNIKIAQMVLTALGYEVRPFLPIRYWEIPRIMLYLYVLAMVCKYWGSTRDIALLNIAGLNLEALTVFFISIQGVAFMPRKLAAPGTSENINDAKQKQAAAKHKAVVANDEAIVLASQLKKVELTIPVKVGEGGKIFGAITGKNISDAAKEQYDLDLDKKKVEIKDPIKSLGSYDVLIRVHPEVTSVIKVHVVEG